MSLDGYIEGPNGEYDWCFADQDYGMTEFFEQIDLIFMGAKSYNLIRSTGDINAFPHPKYVFSDSLQPEEHPDVEIVRKADFIETVKKVKNQFGGHIWLFGGAELVSSFIQEGLLDGFMLSVHPVILGSGKPAFINLSNRVELLHAGTETYSSGLVQIRYTIKPKFDTGVLDEQFRSL